MIDPSTYGGASLYGGENRTASFTASAKREATQTPARQTGESRTAGEVSAPARNGDGTEMSFLDFIKGIIDIINPLQHIPVVSTVYRNLTGDEISPMARVAGDTLYGGPIGTAIAMADVVTEANTGKDIGGTMLAMMTGDRTPAPAKTAPETMLASADDARVMNGIAPAAGNNNTAPAAGDDGIIWDDEVPAQQIAQNFPSSPDPTPHPMGSPAGTSGKAQPAVSSHPVESAPAFQKKAAIASLLPSQKAPAASARTAVSPEPIAGKILAQPGAGQTKQEDLVTYQRMMAGLDKYAEMKKTGLAPSAGRNFSANF